MTEQDKTKVNGFPTAIRQSDKKVAVGELEIKNLIEKTLDDNTVHTDHFATTNVPDKDTITFYIADWCQPCQKLKPYIEKYSANTTVNTVVVKDSDMKGTEGVNGFPTAIRKSDNKVAVGGPEILKLMDDTLQKKDISNNNTEPVNTNTKNTIIFFLSDNCPYSQQLIHIINHFSNITNGKYDIQIFNDKNLSDEDKRNIKYFPSALYKNNLYTNIDDITKLLENIVNQKITVFTAKWCGHCQQLKPKLDIIKQTRNNIEVVDVDDLTDKQKEFVKAFPTAIRESDGKIVTGGPNIIDMINETIVSNTTKTLLLVYSNTCKFSEMTLAEWLDFKQYVIDNNLNIKTIEYEKNDLDNLPEQYKSNIKGFPTLFTDDDKIYEGYDDIINYLKTF